MIVAVVLGIFLIAFDFSLLHIITIAAFAIVWAIYMGLFFTSDTYYYIIDHHSPFQNIYSYKQYKDLWSHWALQNPNIQMQYYDENITHSCQSASFTFISTSSVNTKNEPKIINIDEISGRNPAKYIINVLLKVEWETESEEKIFHLENQMKNCLKKPEDTEINISKDITLPDLLYSLFITQDGKFPPKFTPMNVILLGIFWAGARVNYDFRSISFISETIIKTNTVISDESIQKFSCDQLKLQCWNKISHAECITNFKNNYESLNINAAKESIGLSRERITRAFYLSDGAYGHFEYFINENEKKNYTWSNLLVDTFIKSSNVNGFCYPPFYVGKRDKEIWIVIRGSESTYDWITDGKALTKNLISGSYHKGFYQAGINIWKNIADVFIDKNYEDYTFYFTGHSYGGAVANILHKLASFCYPDMINRMYSFTFGAPPAMGRETSKIISDHVYSFINGNDLVPRLSINTAKRIILLASAIFSAFNKYGDSQSVMKTIENTLQTIKSDGYNDNIISRPIGNIYHLTNKNSLKEGRLKLAKAYTTKFLSFPFINFFGAQDHTIKNYVSKFLLYKDGVMKPTEFDKNVIVNPLKTYKISNTTVFEVMNIIPRKFND